MAISRLFADSVLARLVRGNAAREELIVSMTGVKLGERLIIIGLEDAGLLATLGKKVGLTGRACGVDPSAERVARAQRRAEQAGVLVEAESTAGDLPFDPASFDVAVVRTGEHSRDEPAVARALAQARRVLRDGGRCQVLADAPQGGLRKFWRTRRGGPPPATLVQLLTQQGYRGARILSERDGLVFAEGMARR
jgi:ubiquinone/menaquinone biosynthesis C-methylase UbiE